MSSSLRHHLFRRTKTKIQSFTKVHSLLIESTHLASSPKESWWTKLQMGPCNIEFNDNYAGGWFKSLSVPAEQPG